MRVRWLFAIALAVLAGRAATTAEELDGSALLDKLKALDDKYYSSLTLSGTRIDTAVVDGDEPPTLKNWRLSIEGNRLALYDEVTEILRWEDVLKPGDKRPPPGSGRWWMKTQIIVYGDDTQRTYLSYDMPGTAVPGPIRRGTLYDVAPATIGAEHIDAPGDGGVLTYVNDVMWSAGRGFSREVREVVRVSKRDDGILEVAANGASGRLGTIRWELVIDPEAAYMVRQAKMFAPSIEGQPYMVMSSEGTNWNGDCCYPSESSMSKIGAREVPLRGTRKFETAGFGGDEEFIESMRVALSGPFQVWMDISDYRSQPPTMTTVRPLKEQAKKVVAIAPPLDDGIEDAAPAAEAVQTTGSVTMMRAPAASPPSPDERQVTKKPVAIYWGSSPSRPLRRATAFSGR